MLLLMRLIGYIFGFFLIPAARHYGNTPQGLRFWPGGPKGTIKDGAYVYTYSLEHQSSAGTPARTRKTANFSLAWTQELKNSCRLLWGVDRKLPDLFKGTYMQPRVR
jgi:hypothetical protein